VLYLFVTLGHKLVRGPRRDPLLPAVHSLLSPAPRIRLSVFSGTCALFHFLDHSYPASFPQLAHSSARNRGYTPAWSYQVAPASCRASVPYLFRAGRMPALPVHGAGWASPSPTKKAGHGSRGTPNDPLPHLSPACPERSASFASRVPHRAEGSQITSHPICYPIQRRPFRP